MNTQTLLRFTFRQRISDHNLSSQRSRLVNLSSELIQLRNLIWRLINNCLVPRPRRNLSPESLWPSQRLNIGSSETFFRGGNEGGIVVLKPSVLVQVQDSVLGVSPARFIIRIYCWGSLTCEHVCSGFLRF